MPHKGDIDSSHIPVDGVGGFGLLAVAAFVVYVVPPLRALGIPTVLGGATFGLALVAVRNRKTRGWAIPGAVAAGVVCVLRVLALVRG
ncbi:MAG TPA: hypothetical protein VLT86_11885 [Vicinamibacterales bacterium]|nr:hypothetical protein [Vicinamibacterales bacterium]